MKRNITVLSFFTFAISCLILSAYAETNEDNANKQAAAILQNMSLKEKIGQKLMLDFRYWCEQAPADGKDCLQDFTTMNASVQQVISKNHIGGIIFFSNNLKTIEQITTLTYSFQQTMFKSSNLGMLIGVDQEGGIVARLPRDLAVSFPGNIAIAAATLGNPARSYSAEAGKILADDIKAVGFNVNFAPDVDVNVNPLNPIINVRSFSDDPEIVTTLGNELSKAMQDQGIASTLKHFPGHGDTVTDSHIGLPVVEHTLEQAWNIDLYPFKNIILKNSPDLIMTAHIQYPALDNSQIYAAKAGKYITTPATLSRKIQIDLLRNQLRYEGIVVTDALDMGAIAQNFEPLDATIKSFQAGDDIALMPVPVAQPKDMDKVSEMISKIENAVHAGEISEKEIDESVLRIIKLKIKLGLLQSDNTPLPQKISGAIKVITDPDQHAFEKTLADDAVTLIQNNNNIIPLKVLPNTRIHIITPWLEQGAGIAKEIEQLQYQRSLPQNLQVSFINIAATDLTAEQKAIDNADIVIVGYSTTKSLPLSSFNKVNLLAAKHQTLETLVFPQMLKGDSAQLSANNLLSDDQFAYQVLQYATVKQKKTIFLSLLAPYDLPNYRDVADAMLAGYDHYGYMKIDDTKGYYRGPSMQALTRVIFGIHNAKGKLPINVPNPKNPAESIYPRGFGLG